MRKSYLFALLLAACSKSAAPVAAADAPEVEAAPAADVTATDAPAAVSPADAPSPVTP